MQRRQAPAAPAAASMTSCVFFNNAPAAEDPDVLPPNEGTSDLRGPATGAQGNAWQ